MKKNIIYLLLYYSYDYYEFKEVIAISFDKKKLTKKYKEMNTDFKLYIPPAVPHNIHETEECHYTIEEYKIEV